MSTPTRISHIKVFSDGASRGNPGPSAIAFIILDTDNRVLKQHSEFIGVGTNNQAEYKALISALEVAFSFTDRSVLCFLDSELLVRQLNGEYKVRDWVLKALWREVNLVRRRFWSVSFEYVPRTNVYMRLVDKMANSALDRVENRLGKNRQYVS